MKRSRTYVDHYGGPRKQDLRTPRNFFERVQKETNEEHEKWELWYHEALERDALRRIYEQEDTAAYAYAYAAAAAAAYAALAKRPNGVGKGGK